jgi:hypothetical protein
MILNIHDKKRKKLVILSCWLSLALFSNWNILTCLEFFHFWYTIHSLLILKGAQAWDIRLRDFCSNQTYMDRLVRN